jgi:hypothetical protein
MLQFMEMKRVGRKDLESGKNENNLRRWFWAFRNGGKMCIRSGFVLLGMWSFLIWDLT